MFIAEMENHYHTMTSTQPTIALISSSLPSLDPNGLPYSMILRGEAAELRQLESALSSNHPHTRKQLLVELQTTACDNDADDDFADAEQQVHKAHKSTIKLENVPNETATGDCDSRLNESKKRIRNEPDDQSDDDFEYASDSGHEQLLCYIPSIQCTCLPWDMENVPGELFVTSIRVLFLAQNKMQNDVRHKCNDLAIDGRYIALHAMDSDSTSGNCNEISSHIYCQLSDPSADDGNGMGFQSAISELAPTYNIAEDEPADAEEHIDTENDGSSGEDVTVEVYFRPLKYESKDTPEDSCQSLFDALTQLANLNAAYDSTDSGGGLFSMLSMMAGVAGFGDEINAADEEAESDDDMIIRFGGGNNFVENDDDSEGAAEEERAAMLQRLDDMLVVPPDLRISSDDDEGGQFDDAEEDDASVV
jgi:hypothetical protein